MREIDAKNRQQRIADIWNLRVAQAEKKAFLDLVRKLEQQDRQIRLHEARQDGQRLLDVELSQREAEVLDAQEHLFFNDWSDDEKERFRQQQAQMWTLIPEHLRNKARRMSEGRWG